MVTRVKDIVEIMEAFYPPYLAEKWDNVGLQIGDYHQPVAKVLITLDIDQDAVGYAVDNQVELIISHHPLIFQPLSAIDFGQQNGKIIKTLISAGICVYSAHTNLDKGQHSISQVIAERIGLQNINPLDRGHQEIMYKLVVYVPRDYEVKVRAAILSSGAGWIGNYSDCSFKVEGTGSFKPLMGTNPFIGQVGETIEVEECRMETIVPCAKLSAVINQLIKSHPYEEPAYDLYRLENQGYIYSLGRRGRLANPMKAMDLGILIKKNLGIDSLRITGDLDRIVSEIAVVSGAGASFLSKAHQMGCDALVTGDLKYHEAREAADLNLTVVDAGHQATEQIICSYLPELLAAELEKRGGQAEILSFLNQPYMKNI